MGSYLNKEQFNRNFASTHYQVLHDQPASGEDNTPRLSFFRINDEEELLAAAQNWMHTPCFVMFGLAGGLVNRKDSIRQLNNNTVIILDKAELDPANPIEATAISAAYDRAFGVLEDYISHVVEAVEVGGCGVFKNLEPGNIKWEQYGPVADGLYGWIVMYPDETTGIKMRTKDPTHFIDL